MSPGTPSAPIPSRSSGLLLHPTSLPGPYGVGDLGPAAHDWIETLARARQGHWQFLPLGPTGFGDSPYACYSAFAGSPSLISPDKLVQDGLIDPVPPPDGLGEPGLADFGVAAPFKNELVTRAWENLKAGRASHLRGDFEFFQTSHADWLGSYSLFVALKEAHGGAAWTEWPDPLKFYDMNAVRAAHVEHRDAVQRVAFGQYLFFRQWRQVREHARSAGVRLIGDAPIFVAYDSADVWANPDIFLLDAERKPNQVAGVPPDYFSPTGQLWGNPLYDWRALKQSGYDWWLRRMRAALEQMDVIRLDHFRGFAAAWHVPAGDETAERGVWLPGPGPELFERLRDGLGGLPIIAEDLGVISPDVEDLRDRFALPGMRILQFAFGGDVDDRFLPHNYDRNTVVYTGTHDNDTTLGWYATLPAKERAFLRRYLGRDADDIVWELTRAAWHSVADLAVVPVQDVLNLDTRARMNLPGRLGGNWHWRLEPGAFTEEYVERLADLTEVCSRAGKREER